MHFFKKREDQRYFSDEELSTAARAVRNSMLASLDENPETEHGFSQVFLERMQALFRLDANRSRAKRVFQYAAIFVIGVLMAGLLYLTVNPEARADFIYWVKQTYENSTVYRFFTDKTTDAPEASSEIPDIKLTWLPGKYEVQRSTVVGNHKVLFLSGSSESDYIMFECWLIDKQGMMEILTEGQIHEEVTVNKEKADFYRSSSSDGENVLIWQNEDALLLFSLSSPLDKEVMIKIAEEIVY